jgi:hypothetical protein
MRGLGAMCLNSRTGALSGAVQGAASVVLKRALPRGDKSMG